MGNEPRWDGRKDWETGICPLFVVSEKLTAADLAAAAQTAVR